MMHRLSPTAYLSTLPLSVKSIHTLPADASHRTFHRLLTEEGSLILMDAPPPVEDIRPYCRVAHALDACGLSAPKILHHDDAQGYVVMEDFGDQTFTRVLASTPDAEPTLYQSALSVLVHLTHQAPPSDLPPYDLALLMRELALYPDWAVSFSPGQRTLWDDVWTDVLETTVLSQPQKTLVLRDYHVDNMIWLPQRDGVKQCGLLDFQDAVIGHPAYDLVSLLWDARRDVPDKARWLMLYLNAAGVQAESFMPVYFVLGLQRTLKIIGIFHRLNRRDHKPRYLQHLPRLQKYVDVFLAQPACAPLAKTLGDLLRGP
ncbi:MAG: aminoglycoside phosphotransferase family protein [Alphaproteobacteria bacterium]